MCERKRKRKGIIEMMVIPIVLRREGSSCLLGEETFVETSGCGLEWKGYLPIQSEGKKSADSAGSRVLPR